jgi:hypothetical protein
MISLSFRPQQGNPPRSLTSGERPECTTGARLVQEYLHRACPEGVAGIRWRIQPLPKGRVATTLCSNGRRLPPLRGGRRPNRVFTSASSDRQEARRPTAKNRIFGSARSGRQIVCVAV